MPQRNNRRPSKKKIPVILKTGRYKVSPKQERTVDGQVFDSKWEARVFSLLRSQIPPEHLHIQYKFLLQPKFKDEFGRTVREINYLADFLLGPPIDITDDESCELGNRIVVDAKGHLTDIFKLKSKLFTFRYKKTIVKVTKLADVQALVDSYKEIYK